LITSWDQSIAVFVIAVSFEIVGSGASLPQNTSGGR
jgi:hypothetical protein